MITTLDFLRHGEAEGGTYYRGRTDDPLTWRGRRQMMRSLAGDNGWTHVVSSPLCRCLDFAKTFSRDQRLPLTVDPRLQEIDFGDWEGLDADEIERLWPSALDLFYRNPSAHTPPNGEPYEDFRQRIQDAWQEIKRNGCGKHVLVVTHAGVIRVFFSLLLNMDSRNCFQIQLNHACFSRFKVFHGEASDFVQLISHRQL
ncbi:MAG: histidine phosphatase family protein [Gammaproteobacteria bacterium]